MTTIKNIKAYFKKHPLITTGISAVFNISYALFHFYLAYISSSYWYFTLGILFLVLGFLRLVVLIVGKTTPIRMLRLVGSVMLFMCVILAGLMYLTISESFYPVRSLIFAICQATYCFTLMGIAIFHLFQKAKKTDPQLFAISNISFVATIFSMLSLERMMLGSFAQNVDSFNQTMEMYTGALAFVLIALIAIRLLRYKIK